MQPRSTLDYSILSVRVTLGLWLFVFGASKVLEGITGFSRKVESFKILQDPWNLPVAYLVPWLEILAGLGLMTGALLRGSSRMALALTLLFIFVSGQAWVLGLPEDCGCFGSWFTLSHPQKMLLLGVQLLAVVFVIATERRQRKGVFRGSQMRLPA